MNVNDDSALSQTPQPDSLVAMGLDNNWFPGVYENINPYAGNN